MVVAGVSEFKSNMHNNEDSIVHDHIVHTSAETRDCSEQNMWGNWFLLLCVGGLQNNSVNITDWVMHICKHAGNDISHVKADQQGGGEWGAIMHRTKQPCLE